MSASRPLHGISTRIREGKIVTNYGPDNKGWTVI
jgi:hypothetical protein